ncbi:recombinase family protein [Vibrio parahaemolyticus]|nr:recombinase family protein [Vibrio parahaemolyticus]EJG2036904.1 recombinase family protein [Vibrio parahaemolyticus]EJG2043754.1 recombinase family protein [Vibrio parahaemolyticus]EJG2232155.1 recombinase family protein [Vibrio parahaemolyticus]
MLQELENDIVKVDGLIVYSLSRFSRNLLAQLEATKILQRKKIRLISATEALPESYEDSYVMSSILGLMNEHSSMQNGKVVRDRLRDTALKQYFTGGPIPFGYHSVTVSGVTSKSRKKLQILQEEAELVIEIFNLSEKGINGKPLGVKSIAEVLNKKKSFRRGTKWNRNSVCRILNNRSYIGEFIYNSSDSDPIVVNIPSIIPKEQFYNVQEGLKSRDIFSAESRRIRSKCLLTGLLKCGVCGSSMVVTSGKSGKYSYYQCSKQVRHAPESCSSKRIRRDKVELLVKDKFINKLLTETHLRAICYQAKQRLKENNKLLSFEKTKLSKKINNLEMRHCRLITMVADGDLKPDARINKTITDLSTQLDILEVEMAKLTVKTNLPVRNFGEARLVEVAAALQGYLQQIDNEALKQLMLATVMSVKVVDAAKKLIFEGSNMAVLYLIANAKTGTDFSVPVFITKWRRDRDLNPISLKTYIYQALEFSSFLRSSTKCHVDEC